MIMEVSIESDFTNYDVFTLGAFEDFKEGLLPEIAED